MPEDAFSKFLAQYQQCLLRLGNGKVGINTTELLRLIREERSGAEEFVNLHIKMAATNGGYLQPALVVAGAISVEFGDRSAMERIRKRAEQLGIEDPEQSLAFARDLEEAKTPPPERQSATRWWDGQAPGHRAICDECESPVGRGEGYIVSGRAICVGDQKFSLGEELLCQTCFQKYKHGIS